MVVSVAADTVVDDTQYRIQDRTYDGDIRAWCVVEGVSKLPLRRILRLLYGLPVTLLHRSALCGLACSKLTQLFLFRAHFVHECLTLFAALRRVVHSCLKSIHSCLPWRRSFVVCICECFCLRCLCCFQRRDTTLLIARESQLLARLDACLLFIMEFVRITALAPGFPEVYASHGRAVGPRIKAARSRAIEPPDKHLAAS